MGFDGLRAVRLFRSRGADRQASYPEFQGVYSDRIGAAKALRNLGKGTFEATFGQKFDEVPPGLRGVGTL